MNTHKRVSLITVAFILMLSACKKEEIPPDFLEIHQIKSTHRFNESPCPQKLGETGINCSNTTEPGCTADSAFVVNDHPHLWNAFTGDVYSVALSDTAEVRLAVWFNCRAASDISHNVEVQFFNSGELVETEYLRVDFTYEK